MKKIYYFSGTGNTLYLAKILSEKCGYDLINISAVKDKEVILENNVGILFPLYAMGIPKIVEEFLQKIKIENISYLFAITTCGGSNSGIAFMQIKNILEKKGVKIDYSEYCHMPDNYLKLFELPTKDEAIVDIKKSQEKIEIIAENILNEIKNNIKENKYMYIPYLLLYKYWRKKLKNTYKSFILKEEKCISCGICRDVCPVNNIDFKENKPKWNINCEDCLACVNLCPTLAIECGGKSKINKRYKNPYISINELK